MHGWQTNKKRTCASPVVGRAMPENEKPPMRVDIYFYVIKLYFLQSLDNNFILSVIKDKFAKQKVNIILF